VFAASAATVEVAVAEKKEDETGLQERERESRWLLGGCAGFLWWIWYLWWCVGRVCWYYRRRRQLWKRWREKERKTEKVAETGKKLIFWLILDPNFSFLRLLNPPLFIAGGRGQFFLHRGKIFSP
jgi:hypothetical protein